MTSSKRFLLVDQNALNIVALSGCIDAEPDLCVIGTAIDSRSGFRMALDEQPDVVVINVDLPGRGAFTAAEELAHRLPAARVIFLADYVSDVFLDEALRVKGRGYLLTTESADRLIEHFRRVLAGQMAFTPEVENRLEYDPATGQYTVAVSSYLATLTSRQLEVLRHLIRGDSVKEVARTMVLSERAIESHKYRIMRKLGIHDRVALARYAIREGLTVP